MEPIRKTLCLFAAGLGTVWLVSTDPAQAGDKSDARSECRDLMGDRDFKNVDVDEVRKNKKGNVVVEMDATRRGNDRSVDCVYNPDKDKARIRK